MDEKEKYSKTEIKDDTCNIPTFSSKILNVEKQLKQKLDMAKNSKITFNQKVIANLFKNANLKKNHMRNSKLNFIHFKTTVKKDQFQMYKINSNLHDLPIMLRFHNITNEHISELIKSEYNIDNSFIDNSTNNVVKYIKTTNNSKINSKNKSNPPFNLNKRKNKSNNNDKEMQLRIRITSDISNSTSKKK